MHTKNSMALGHEGIEESLRQPGMALQSINRFYVSSVVFYTQSKESCIPQDPLIFKGTPQHTIYSTIKIYCCRIIRHDLQTVIVFMMNR